MYGNADKSFVLIINDKAYQFCSDAEFEFALKARTSIPARKLIHLLQYKHLRNDALKFHAREMRFIEQLSPLKHHPRRFIAAMREFGFDNIAHEHNWRDIFTSLYEAMDGHERYLRVAIDQYERYLESRSETLKILSRVVAEGV